MKENSRIVSENTENIGGVVVVTRVTQKGQDFPSTRFYTKSADGSLTQLKKEDYFDMLSAKSLAAMEVSKHVRLVNAEYKSISYGEFAKEERSKVDWYYWNQENNLAEEKAKAILALMDEVHEINDYVDEDKDMVSIGGWLYKKGEAIGFISHHLKAKSNLDITLYNREESMQHWEQLKSDYVVNKFKYIPELLVVIVCNEVVSEYYITPQLTDEQMLEMALGIKTEQDFSFRVSVFEQVILGLDCLVHVIHEDDGDRVYFVEELNLDSDTNTEGDEDEL